MKTEKKECLSKLNSLKLSEAKLVKVTGGTATSGITPDSKTIIGGFK